MRDADFVERAVRNAKANSVSIPRWVAVKKIFAVGSTTSKLLCKRFNLDPDKELKGEFNEFS